MSEFLRREIPAAETHIAVECVWQPLVKSCLPDATQQHSPARKAISGALGAVLQSDAGKQLMSLVWRGRCDRRRGRVASLLD